MDYDHDQKKKSQQEIATRGYNSITRQMNVSVASVRLMDVFLNAVIDLHTSDDPLLLHNYSKLRVHDKLSACGFVFHHKVQLMISSSSSEEEVAGGGGGGGGAMDEAEVEKCSETLENVRAFLDYKNQFTS
jgi:hypothetical protein